MTKSSSGELTIHVRYKFNFGGPVQPRGAVNYVAITDFIPWLDPTNIVHAIVTGFQGITFVNPLGESPLKAHSFLGSTYQGALRESIQNNVHHNE